MNVYPNDDYDRESAVAADFSPQPGDRSQPVLGMFIIVGSATIVAVGLLVAVWWVSQCIQGGA